jgi:hypothetical protein
MVRVVELFGHVLGQLGAGQPGVEGVADRVICDPG